ncbi:MAG: diguanylate cyclase [Burkholderiales bacterium]
MSIDFQRLDIHRLDLYRIARPLIVPAVILMGTALLLAAAPALPATLTAIGPLLPWLTILIGIVLSVLFNRGRAFIAFLSLLASFAGISIASAMGPGEFAERAVFTASAILVPANILFALIYAERGVYQHRNYRWWLIAAAEIIVVAWIASAGRNPLSGTAWQGLLTHWLLASPPTPLLGRIALAAAFVAAVWRAWPSPPANSPRPLDIGMAALVIAFFLGCEWHGTPGAFSAFVACAAILLLVALMQESHRLAFYDELTSLPGRRALEERLPGLGPQCVMAMIDVDHFKKFNDTHGHDIGDQVLKLVAARLAEVRGGGIAYRYGGEEFAVLFPGKTIDEALPALEALRASIETYRMTVRSDDRPKELADASQRRDGTAAQSGNVSAGNTANSSTSAGAGAVAKANTDKVLSVTVSIGAAAREPMENPSQALRAADQALYRAKQAGRNRVSR